MIKTDRILKTLPLGIIFGGMLVIGWWLFNDPTKDMTVSGPDQDAFTQTQGIAEDIAIGEFFNRFSDGETLLTEAWPVFRGVYSDNIYRSDIELIDRFGSEPPEILWSVELGEGHAGAAIYEGLVYVLDYDEELRADMLRCFDLVSGQEIWRRWYNVARR